MPHPIRAAQHPVFWHPAIISATYVVLFILAMAWPRGVGPLGGGMVFALLAPAFGLTWACSLFALVSSRGERKGLPFFLIAIASIMALAIVGLARVSNVACTSRYGEFLEGALLATTLFSFLASTWVAAKALVEREDNEKAPWHRVVGTFLLVFYLFAGIWFLYPRVVVLSRLNSD